MRTYFLVLRMKQKQRSTTLNRFPHTLLRQGTDKHSLSSSMLTKRCRGGPFPKPRRSLRRQTLSSLSGHTIWYSFLLFSGYWIHETQPNIAPLPCSTTHSPRSLTDKDFRKAFLIFLLLATAHMWLRNRTKLKAFSAPCMGTEEYPRMLM